MQNGNSGRVTVLVLLAVMFGVGLWVQSLIISIIFGIATFAAAVSVIRAALSVRAMRRISDRHPPA
jgi:hypothetical protein